MGWLPVFPHPSEPTYCHMCGKLVRDLITNLTYYIVWTPDDDPEMQPHNVYYICQEHKKESMKLNKHCIKRPARKDDPLDKKYRWKK